LSDYENIRKGGIIAINLKDNDELIGVKLTDGSKEIILGTKLGQSIRFSEADVRTMGRDTTGVKGIQLSAQDQVIGMDIIQDELDILIVTTKGYGKRTSASEYRAQTRGGKGIKTLNVTKKNGFVAGLKVVNVDDDLMIVTTNAMVIRLEMDNISSMGRYTQGVRLINVKKDEEVATVARVEVNDDLVQELELDTDI